MATKNTTAPRLEVRGIRKTFGQNAVLKGINLSVDAGEVVALIGGNGAGKSTLMKIIMGIYTCDEGDILIDGQAVKLGKPAASLAQGIYLVPQEPMLFPNMTVLENILMGFNENEGELKKRLNECMKELNFDLNLQRKANTLSIAEQQLVELLRGMMRNDGPHRPAGRKHPEDAAAVSGDGRGHRSGQRRRRFVFRRAVADFHPRHEQRGSRPDLHHVRRTHD